MKESGYVVSLQAEAEHLSCVGPCAGCSDLPEGSSRLFRVSSPVPLVLFPEDKPKAL